MAEPTEGQMKTLREDIISGRVMIVEVEHYKGLTDELSNSYDANKEQAKRIIELEKTLDKIRLISGRSYKKPVTSVAAMKSMKIINKRCVQALKGGK